ncbi:MAG: o-succinylbenzoate synthase [Candidatus Protochlamydia sp.]|nr:o-succinylbenzoate synthase [Candidatus Protochlamydia sp.]
MKIAALYLYAYEMSRSGILIHLVDEGQNSSWGEIAPLPKWSMETLKESLLQLNFKQKKILEIEWTLLNWSYELKKLNLLPAVSFGLESAILALLCPLPEYTILTSALLMGSPQEILNQAVLRRKEGFTSAKLKVGNLALDEAADLIHQLKDQFYLRIDVNRAWRAKDSLHFFSQFPLDAFDYVEEPFENPNDLNLFTHPLAVDESFPQDLTFEQLESMPALKAMIYKPTLQGGMLGCLQLLDWTKKRGLDLILSSSFESDLGLAYVGSIAHRLSLSEPVGIGTYHFLEDYLCQDSLGFSSSHVTIPVRLHPILSKCRLLTLYE